MPLDTGGSVDETIRGQCRHFRTGHGVSPAIPADAGMAEVPERITFLIFSDIQDIHDIQGIFRVKPNFNT